MPHRIYKYTNTLYDYAIINTYVSLIYELKRTGKVFTSKFVRTEPSSYKKIIYRAAASQRLRNTTLQVFYGISGCSGNALRLYW
jgi:hypothetical protein